MYIYIICICMYYMYVFKRFYGICEKTFKECYNNLTVSFRNKSKERNTKLSKYIWELKNNRKNCDIKRFITCKADP